MNKPNWQQCDEGKYLLTDDLNRDTVPALWLSIKELAFSQSTIELSLVGLTKIDSAGMVMLIHLIEHAKKQNCHIMLSFVPDQLSTLFQLSNVEQLIAGHLKNNTGVNCG